MDFYRKQENNKYFEITHPIHNEIQTRVVASGGEWQSVTFLIDENNEYPWLFVSDRCAIDYIITPDKIYTFPFAGVASVFNLENWVYEIIKEQKLLFHDITWGFRFCDHRPWHDFYEGYSNFFALNTDKNIKDLDNAFFIPQRYKRKKQLMRFICEQEVCLFIYTIIKKYLGILFIWENKCLKKLLRIKKD